MSKTSLAVWIFPAMVAMLDAGEARGQTYPAKPIRILTTGLGGSTDLAARTVAQGLIDSAGWTVVVDNRGSTIVASDMVAKAPPDGYTHTRHNGRSLARAVLPEDALRSGEGFRADHAGEPLAQHPGRASRAAREDTSRN